MKFPEANIIFRKIIKLIKIIIFNIIIITSSVLELLNNDSSKKQDRKNSSHEPRNTFLSLDTNGLETLKSLVEVKTDLLKSHKKLGLKNTDLIDNSDTEKEMNADFFEEPVFRKMTFYQNISRLDTSIL